MPHLGQEPDEVYIDLPLVYRGPIVVPGDVEQIQNAGREDAVLAEEPEEPAEELWTQDELAVAESVVGGRGEERLETRGDANLVIHIGNVQPAEIQIPDP
jgi:hypothetical protein